jgi:RNA polymerase sigma factor (sigma-70 family)
MEAIWSGSGETHMAMMPDPIDLDVRGLDSLDLDSLYRAHQAGMTRLAHTIVGSNAVAEEIVHDAFVRMSRTPAGRVREPVPYLRTVVVNLSRNWVRRQVIARRVADRAQPMVLAEPELDETWTALQRLPIKYRTALALRFYDDLPDDEIAEAMGCRRATVRSLVHRGLDLLREELS